MSFCRYNKTLHARVEQWDHKYSFDRESATAYSSITMAGLLTHYSVAEYCMFFEPMLVTPLHRAEPQPLMSLCRAAIGNCTSYQGVEKLPIPTSLKTYLKEYNYCIKPKSKKDDLDGRRKRNSTLCVSFKTYFLFNDINNLLRGYSTLSFNKIHLKISTIFLLFML